MSILVNFQVHMDSICYEYELVKWNILHNCKLHILVLSLSIQFFHVIKSLYLYKVPNILLTMFIFKLIVKNLCLYLWPFIYQIILLNCHIPSLLNFLAPVYIQLALCMINLLILVPCHILYKNNIIGQSS